MLEERLLVLERKYRLYAWQVAQILFNEETSVERLSEIWNALNKVCFLSARLCSEAICFSDDPDIYVQASNIDGAWVNLRNQVSSALMVKPAIAA